MDYESVLKLKVGRIVNSYINAAMSEIQSDWGSVEIDGTAEFRDASLTIVRDNISRSIIAAGQKAWIAEYGRGSLMEKGSSENPYLQDYISGKIKDPDGNPLFNPHRLGHALAIVGRDHGYYYDLDGNMRHSNGNLAGKVIEGDRYKPSPAYHFIRRVLFGNGNDGIFNLMLNEIQEAAMVVLVQLLNEFPKEIVLYDK